MDKEKLIAHLLLIQSDINVALKKAEDAKIKGAINWADLSCVEVQYRIDESGVETYLAIIEEADPNNDELVHFLSDYMRTQSRVLIDYPLYFETEW